MADRWRALLLAAVIGGATLAYMIAVGYARAGVEEGAATEPDASRVGGTVSDECRQLDLDALFERMDENGATVHSGHVVVHTQEGPISIEQEAWFDGSRVRVDKRTVSPGSTEETSTVIADGQRVTEIETDSSGDTYASAWDADGPWQVTAEVDLSVGGLLIWWPLQPVMLHMPPRGSILASRRVWLPRLLGEDEVKGLRCLRLVLLPLGKDATAVRHESMWVAPDRGYAVARFERHTVCPGAGDWYAYGEIWGVQEWMHPIEGLWLPRVATWRRYEQSLEPEAEPREFTSRSEVIAAEFNVEIPDEAFSVEIPEKAQRHSTPLHRARYPLGRGG